MSGVIEFRKPGTPAHGSLEEKLQVENDKRLFRLVGSGWITGGAVVLYIMSIDLPPLPTKLTFPEPKKPDVIVEVRPPIDYHGKISDLKKKMKETLRPVPKGQRDAKPIAKNPVKKDPGRLNVTELTSRSDRTGLLAYDLLDRKFMKNLDLDKLGKVTALTRTEETRLSGRLGKKGTEFNQAYMPEGDPNGTVVDVPPLALERAPTGDNHLKKVLTSEVEVQNEHSMRSTASILAVIRQHSPGLRHIYNKHLKTNPGFHGKITVRFAIAPRGHVVDIALVGSTTRVAEFDREVVQKMMSWRFEPIRGVGNDIVTVPISFSE